MSGRIGTAATPGDVGSDIVTVFGGGPAVGVVTLPVSSLAPVCDASAGEYFILRSAVGTAVVVGAPTNPPASGQHATITLEHQNASGGAHSGLTFNAAFKSAGAFVTAADTKSRTITFKWNGTNWVETGRAAADI